MTNHISILVADDYFCLESRLTEREPTLCSGVEEEISQNSPTMTRKKEH